MTPNPIIALSIFSGLMVTAGLLWYTYQRGWLGQSAFHAKKTLIEDILKQLYHVEYSGRIANLNAMAAALKISDRKLLDIVEEMSIKDLIKLENNTLKLTSGGTDYALKIIRVHRLWEKYLSEKTGFEKSEWHDMAERAEHLLTTEQTDQLNQELGNPRFDPHGDPIPTKEGEIITSDWGPLSALKENTLAKIVHIEDEPAAIYQQILDKKLHIGSQVKVTESNDYEVQFFSEGKEYKLSSIVASNISVQELNGKEIFEENTIRLTALKSGESAKILGLSSECRGINRRRLLDLGFINGSVIEAEFESPMKELKAYSIRNTVIALRDDQAELILIEKEE